MSVLDRVNLTFVYDYIGEDKKDDEQDIVSTVNLFMWHNKNIHIYFDNSVFRCRSNDAAVINKRFIYHNFKNAVNLL